MNQPVDLRFIPKWLSGVMKHYETGYDKFESIVSRHDVKLYNVANNILRTKLNLMRIRDFNMPAADLNEGISEDDALFALYGQNEARHTVPQFNLTSFKIITDQRDGIYLVEVDDAGEQDLVKELLVAIATYRGVKAAYESDCFKRYLASVTNDRVRTHTAEEFHERLKTRLAEAAGNPAGNAGEGFVDDNADD